MEERKHHSAGFLNGLMWGAVIGGGLVFLLATKKGRRILRELSEAGEDFLGDLSALENIEEPVEENVEKAHEGENGNSSRKRFFKGIKKKT